MISVRNKPKPKKEAKPKIAVGQDEKLLCMIQKGGKLKAFQTGLNGKFETMRKGILLVVESREDLMFVKEEYKFHQDRLREMELRHREALRKETIAFFDVLEASRVYRPHRVKVIWEKR